MESENLFYWTREGIKKNKEVFFKKVNQWNKKKITTKIINFNLITSIIILDVGNLNIPKTEMNILDKKAKFTQGCVKKSH